MNEREAQFTIAHSSQILSKFMAGLLRKPKHGLFSALFGYGRTPMESPKCG
jgi:hypothetical protein